MRAWRIAGVLMLATGAVDGAAGLAARDTNRYFLQPGDVVLFLGNSITDQAGPEIELLRADFRKQYPELADGAGAVRFIKAGIGGEQAFQGGLRLPDLLKQHKPSVCVVGYGTCEVTFKNEESYTSAMKSILKQLKDAQVAATVVSAPPPSASNWKQPAQWPASQFEKGLPTMVQAAKQLAAEAGVPFVDSFAALTAVAKKSGKELTTDGIHLNADGYRAMTDALQAAWSFGNPLRKVGNTPAEAVSLPHLRILPVGDSITRGSYLAVYTNGPYSGQGIGLPSPVGGGWRKPLQDKLRAAGNTVEFVGELDSMAYGSNGVVDADSDPHHHGLAGFSNQGILDGGVVPTTKDVLDAKRVSEVRVPGIVTVLTNRQPNVVLLMSGANGFDAVARDRLIRAVVGNTTAHVLVATIPPQSPPRAGYEQVEPYNRSLPVIVTELQEKGHAVHLVDMHAALSTADLLPDGVHPSAVGMAKMAEVWFQALAAIGLTRAPAK